jgi:hypothetical protein
MESTCGETGAYVVTLSDDFGGMELKIVLSGDAAKPNGAVGSVRARL